MRNLLLAAFALFMLSSLVAGQDATVTARAAQMPAVLGQLGLQDARLIPKRREHHGQVVRGRLPDGSWVEIDLDRGGNVEEVEAEGRTGFAARTVETLIPAAVRNNAAYPSEAFFRKLEFEDDDRIEIEGYRQDGMRFKAEFTAGGRLVEMKTEK